jgi:lysophospholipid acyltransferase (LPLAT)-like uncharacterized protein
VLKKKLFRSWDRFVVPYPHGRGVFLWGPPLWVAPEAGELELEAKRLELEAMLNRMTAEADELASRKASRVTPHA